MVNRGKQWNITHLLQGLLTIAEPMFWSMKKSMEREKPRPMVANTAGTGKRYRGGSWNMS